jgi:hypothetical protein
MVLFHSDKNCLLTVGETWSRRIDDQISPHYTRWWDQGRSSLAEIARQMGLWRR